MCFCAAKSLKRFAAPSLKRNIGKTSSKKVDVQDISRNYEPSIPFLGSVLATQISFNPFKRAQTGKTTMRVKTRSNSLSNLKRRIFLTFDEVHKMVVFGLNLGIRFFWT